MRRKDDLSSPKKHTGLMFIMIFLIVVVATQIWSTMQNTSSVERIVADIKSIQDGQLTNEKNRQEVISLRIQNEMKALFWSRLLGILGPMITALVALLGALLGLRNYLHTREKDRLDRAATDLRYILEQLANKESRVRAMGVVGLQHFFVADKKEYHLRALSALTTVARLENDPEVLQCIRIAAERAVDQLPPFVLKQVSWQEVKLKGADLSGHDLAGIDFRDAVLDDTELTHCDLSGAILTNARLNGAMLDYSRLIGADCVYADFAGASLVKANLNGALLFNTKVLQMNMDGADLKDAQYILEDMPWEKIRNWRNAVFDEGVLEELKKRFGPESSGLKVLMLMWEIPPLVVGGTWTACYHLVRRLRQSGADVRVVVPWDKASILATPFGCEVDVIPMEITPPGICEEIPGPQPEYGGSPYSTTGPYGFGQARPYGYSPYSSRYDDFPSFPPSAGPYGWSPYASSSPFARPSDRPFRQPLYGPYSSASPDREKPAHDFRSRSSILSLAEEFKKRLLRYMEKEKQPFDIIHAHDWITFGAAKAAAQKTGKPWIVHFHSSEKERRAEKSDVVIERIENDAVHKADQVIVPSQVTKDILEKSYEADPSKVTVVPNALSQEEINPLDMGSFETRRVVFIGRLTSQKGLDLFVEIARRVRRTDPGIQFWIFGEGEEYHRLREEGITWKRFIPWDERGLAYCGASVVLMTSRNEPFGMVVLEAMQHGVPVLYPQNAGAAEVLESGVKIDPKNIEKTAATLTGLLSKWEDWVDVVEKQSLEIANYSKIGYEKRIIEKWEKVKRQT